MPWKTVSVMSLRQEFLELMKKESVNVSELCRRYQISRKTGYKWRRRFDLDGMLGLADRSRRPHHIVFQVPPCTEDEVIRLRKDHPAWGARKIRKKLQQANIPTIPACSTITRVLHRHGLINPEDAGGRQDWQRFESPVPNDLWQMDFKGPVKTLAGPGHPLTILDDFSRFNLCLRALPNQRTAGVQEAMTATFRQYGLPNIMLVDNGGPWGSDPEHPYTPLTVWLMRLQVRVTHSRPYHPETLGKDERFHRTLKKELLSRSQWQDLAHLQNAFNPWRHVYNFERPHDALGLEVPGTRYQPSLRSFPESLPPIEYSEGTWVRKVQQEGEFSFQGRTFRVSKAFRGYPIGVQPTSVDGKFDVLFTHYKISHIDLGDP